MNNKSNKTNSNNILRDLVREEIKKALKESNMTEGVGDTIPRSLLGIFQEIANEKSFRLDQRDSSVFMECMYGAYKLGKSSGTWK